MPLGLIMEIVLDHPPNAFNLAESCIFVVRFLFEWIYRKELPLNTLLQRGKTDLKTSGVHWF